MWMVQLNSTPKSNLLNFIDLQFITVSPSSIIDAAFLLCLQINAPDTFGGIARSILSQKMGYSGNAVIQFVAYKWLTMSIKDIELVD